VGLIDFNDAAELGVRTMAYSFQNQHSPSPDSVLGFTEQECQLPAGSWPVGKHISNDFEKQVMAVDAANQSSSKTSIALQAFAAQEPLNSSSGLPAFLPSAASTVCAHMLSLSAHPSISDKDARARRISIVLESKSSIWFAFSCGS
jgi:hypothetical protein